MEPLRDARKRAGWSQAALGARVGVDAVSIHNVESGKTIPRPHLRQAIERALGTHIDWVYTRIGWPVDSEGGGSAEEAVLRQVWDFIFATQSANTRRSRVRWLRTLTDYLEALT